VSNSPDCGLDITSRPIASFQIAKPDDTLTVSVVGGRNDGFVVRKGDLFWTECTSTISEVPTMGPVKGGWQPGRYDIYPVARYGDSGKPQHFNVELYRPTAPVVVGNAQKLVISGKLDKPMFVEVSTKPNRRKLRDTHAGYNCHEVALPAAPDIALEIERPVPGLTIRPLPTMVPVTLRSEHEKNRGCVQHNNGNSRNREAPSYVAQSELHFDTNDEGAYNISLGTPNETDEVKVTLMVYDASTKLDGMYVRPFGGEKPSLEQRWIGYQMPQLDADELGTGSTYEQAEQAARVFAAVPKQALVYAKLTFDKDIGGGDGFPVKNEPLVVLGLENERATVMTADGMRFHVKTTHLLLAPDGATAVPSQPRPLQKLDIGGVISLLSPSQKKLGEAHWAKVKAREACQDRAWEPYRRQLPSISRPSNVDIVVVKSAHTKAIEEAGERAIEKQCGTDDAFEKKTEAERVKLAVEVEKNRVKLLAVATANL
jgi:hypothetical protein